MQYFIGILVAAFAYLGYNLHREKGKRIKAQAQLQTLKNKEERVPVRREITRLQIALETKEKTSEEALRDYDDFIAKHGPPPKS